MKYRALALVVASGLLLAADKADDEKKVLEKLQGTWKVESAKQGGNEAPKEVLEKLRLVVEDNKFTIKDGANDEQALVKLDPTKKPATLDISTTKGAKETVLGIYELDGDSLKLCWAKGGKERPKAFESKEGTETVLFVLKREKK